MCITETTKTENGATAYTSTSSELVDLFFMSVRDKSITDYLFPDRIRVKLNIKSQSQSQSQSDDNSDNSDDDTDIDTESSKESNENKPDYLKKLFIDSYNVNPELTLKLLAHLRDVRGGKGEKDLTFFYLQILYKYCPQTYHSNCWNLINKYGCYLDLIKMIKLIGVENSEVELNHIIEQLKIDDTDCSLNKPISLLAKWVPSQTTKRYINVYCAIRNMLNKGKNSDKKYRVLISKLRKHINVLETLMSANRWDEINFSSVPSQAMRIYGKEYIKKQPKNVNKGVSKSGAFYRHCLQKYKEYLENVKKGVEKINATGIQPHQLVEPYINSGLQDDVIELQWKQMIKNLNMNNNKLKNSYAVVDVSGSMWGEPMEVAIALGLVINEISGNDIITFSESPTWHKVDNTLSLHDKVKSLLKAKWGGSTNIESTFNMMLNSLKNKKQNGENIDNVTLFIFSDMQFNMSTGGDTDTHFTIAKNKFFKAEIPFPNIVFWNLRVNNTCKGAIPITIGENGVVMLSGFSEQLLKIFLDESKTFDVYNIVVDLISKYDISDIYEKSI
jgi:hypothetical protein